MTKKNEELPRLTAERLSQLELINSSVESFTHIEWVLACDKLAKLSRNIAAIVNRNRSK